MSDNEIIKALERCTSDGGCTNCPLHWHEECVDYIYTLALNLINRQKKEIERLDKLVIKERKEIDRLYDYIQYTKAEARKEFAERLKAKAGKAVDLIHICVDRKYLSLSEIIDNLVKEMENKP